MRVEQGGEQYHVRAKKLRITFLIATKSAPMVRSRRGRTITDKRYDIQEHAMICNTLCLNEPQSLTYLVTMVSKIYEGAVEQMSN